MSQGYILNLLRSVSFTGGVANLSPPGHPGYASGEPAPVAEAGLKTSTAPYQKSALQAVLLAMLGALSLSAAAQSAVVVGNTGSIRDCYSRAEVSVTFNAADDKDIEVCSKALEDINLSLSDRSATLVNLGILQLAAGQFDAARTSYDKALALVDDQGETHINIANMYVYQKRYQEAIDVYTRGIELMPRRRHIAFLNRGLAHEYLEQFAAAYADYERALEIAPDWVRAKKMMARVERRLREQNAD